MASTPCTPSVATGVEPSRRARCVRRRYRTGVMLPSVLRTSGERTFCKPG